MASNPPNTNPGPSATSLLPLQTSGGRALAEYGAEQSLPTLQSISRGNHSSATVLIVPKGKEVKSLKPFLDEYLPAPERKKGAAMLTTLDSLIAHVNRFKDDESAVFAMDDRAAPSITAVLDYHKSGAGSARFGGHRANYTFPLSDEWKAWMGQNGKAMGQGEFAEFMEDRIADVLAPPANLDRVLGEEITDRDTGGDFDDRTPDEQLAYLAKLLKGQFAGPSTMVSLSRGLAVHADERVQQAVTLENGTVNVQWETQHNDAGGNRLTVPNLFLIGIPVFRLGARYRIAVRLRYRLGQGSIKWFYELYRHDVVFDDAFREACERVQKETALPLFYGTPE